MKNKMLMLNYLLDNNYIIMSEYDFWEDLEKDLKIALLEIAIVKMIKKERLNEKATLVQFQNLDGFDIQLIERLFGRKLERIEK